MRTKRRALLTVWCLLAATLGTQLALGQEQPQKPPAETQADEEIRLTRVLIDTERQALVTKAMDLTPGEMQRFWPLYREYRCGVEVRSGTGSLPSSTPTLTTTRT